MWKNKTNKIDEELKNLYEQLEVVFGKEKSKDLVKQVKQVKLDHPDSCFSFIFGENGELTVIKKDKDNG